MHLISLRSFHRPLPPLTRVALLLAALGLAGCGPSSEDCRQLCDWWAGTCTAEPLESCMEDCSEAASGDVDYARQQCLDSSASSCKGASCCLRFVYTDYYFRTNCL